jgi:hypothetical protein
MSENTEQQEFDMKSFPFSIMKIFKFQSDKKSYHPILFWNSKKSQSAIS